MNTYIKPMTPTRRAEIDEVFENAINELRECEQNSLVQTQIGALLTCKRIIHKQEASNMTPLWTSWDMLPVQRS